MMKRRIVSLAVFIFTGLMLLVSCSPKAQEPEPETPPTEYTITFEVHSDSLDTVSVSYEERTYLTEEMILKDVYHQTKPTKEGYTAEHWYLNPSFQTRIAFPYLITEDETFYLKWVSDEPNPTTFDVTFVDCETTLKTEKVTGNSMVTSWTPPAKTGYTFEGWYADSDYQTVFDFTQKITKNTTIYAKYVINVYTVEFWADTEKLKSVSVEYNTCVTRPTELETKTGYTFDNWYADANFKTVFDFAHHPITENTCIYGKFDVIAGTNPIEVVSFGGYREGAYVELRKLSVSKDKIHVFYQKDDGDETEIDSELIRVSQTTIRADILGLSAGTYSITIRVDGIADTKKISSVEVLPEDRSGYAHFKNTVGIGAYKNDGTLKANAVVVYVTDETKNTVTAVIGGKTYTGLVNIITACNKESYALDVRILGEIQTTQWNSKSHGTGSTSARQENLENTFNYQTDPSGWDETKSSSYSRLYEDQIIAKGINTMSQDSALGITKLEGLTNYVSRTKTAKKDIYEYDSYYNMLDVNGGYNITIEGIGTDAAIFQWGFTFKKCNFIEVKNLRFYQYTEDAIGFEGGSNSDINYGNYWIHQCTFDIGVNHWDVCYEADKGDGDGSTDVKYCHNVTIDYCRYNGTHKTNLIGSSDSALQYNITLHHNYYNECGSRMPLVRQANIHIYNNYYYKSTSYCSSIRANAFAFIENNYYDQAKNPFENKATIKAYGNVFSNIPGLSDGYTQGNTVSSRTAQVSGECHPAGSTDYANFDINENLFYYQNGKSDVLDLLEANAVPACCQRYSGVLKTA